LWPEAAATEASRPCQLTLSTVESKVLVNDV
jgi:hypothetical protein